MHITDYFNQMPANLDGVTAISSRNIIFDQRSDVAGYIRGVIDFTDGSQLHFSEYVNVEWGINRMKYSYHFMQKNQLLFRYDNASNPKARRLKTYPHHKHTTDGKMIESSAPTLVEVIAEIQSFFLNSV